MKIYFCENPLKPISLFVILISIISPKGYFVNAEYLSEDTQIDTSTKAEEGSLDIPSNPFEIVEMIRRFNSLNDATKPSDAISDALESFKDLEEQEKI